MSIANRFLFAVIVVSMVVKIGSAGSVTKVAPSCLTQQEFEKQYGHEAFQILSQTANPQELLQQQTNRFFKNADLKTELLKDVMLEVARPLDDSEVSQVESEIKVIKIIDQFFVSPKFYACTFEVIKNGEELAYFYYIIQGKQYQKLSESYILLKLFGSEPIGQIFTFIQIALNIQTLHARGYVHQDIKPENIMSTDDHLSGVRLINFSKTVRVGEPGLEGTKYYYSPDKFKGKDFIASYHHDAYAFAITILSILDFTNSFEKITGQDCPKTLEVFSDNCKRKFKGSLFAFKMKDFLATDIVNYIEDYLFQENKPLDISEMIVELIRIYRTLVIGKEQDYTKMTKYIAQVEKVYQSNLNFINKIKASLPEKNMLII